MPFLELRNIRASIDGTTIIDDVSFSIERGELLTLVGPSGCGKTTTLRVIAGFLESDQGDVLMDGISILSLPPHKRNIGFVFQDYALFPHMNVYDNINFGLRMHDWGKVPARNRVDELLSLVHLEGLEERGIGELSGGEKQRVALARALAPEPDLLLLDEPLSALDARLRDELRREIKRIQRELGLTVIYVTHDQEEALSLSSVIAVMNAGRIEQIGKPVDVYRNPATLFTAKFLGSANLLRGVVGGEPGDGNIYVTTDEGEMVIDEVKDGAISGTVTLFFRGEDAILIPLGTDPIHESENLIVAVLKDLDFFGDEIRAIVRGRGGGRFTLKLIPGQMRFDPWEFVGKDVVVGVDRFGIIWSG